VAGQGDCDCGLERRAGLLLAAGYGQEAVGSTVRLKIFMLAFADHQQLGFVFPKV